MIFEHASVIDCHQDGLNSDPESWIFAGILLSILSSFVVLCLIRMAYYDKTGKWLKFCRDKYCLDICNGSFVSFTFMALLTIAYYIFRIAISDQLSKVNTATSICLIIWPVIIWFVVWHLNYVPKPATVICSPSVVWVFYWTALFMYSCETAIKLFAAMLDAAYNAVPVIENKFPDESSKGFFVILFGFRLAFHTSVFLFFWNKIFHGNGNLFSEPYPDLEGDDTTPSSQLEGAATTSMELQPRVGYATSTDEEGQDGSTSTHREGEHGTSSISEVRVTVPPRPPAAKPERPPVPKKNEKKYVKPPGEVDPNTNASTSNQYQQFCRYGSC